MKGNEMRTQLLKFQKRNSTKQERRIVEILKRNRIKFVAKAKVRGREVDFLIGRVALEIDGDSHKHTDVAKDTMLFAAGYVPIHILTQGRGIAVVEHELIQIIKANNNVSRRTRTS